MSQPVASSKRAATKAHNRGAILEAAREVFAELGYDAAGVRDVIRRTDLASGTFYNYFPDKEAVFRAVVDESATEVRAATARRPRDGARRSRSSSATRTGPGSSSWSRTG